MNYAVITKEEVLSSRFVTKNQDGTLTIHRSLSKKDAEKMSFREICVFLGASGISFRGIRGSVENANDWLLNENKEYFMDINFPQGLNCLF